MKSKPKHILVIRLSAMGDVAMSVPVIRAFCKKYPEVKLTILTRAFFTPFFRDLPNVNVFPADLKGKHKGVLGLFRLSQELKGLKINAVADLHNVLRTKILKFLFLGYTFKQINKGRSEKKALISGKVFKQLKTTHQRYADVFKELGYPVELNDSPKPTVYNIDEATQQIIGDSTKKTIGIAPFAQYESKMYPLDLLEVVIEHLSKNYKILLFGGGEKEIAVLNGYQNKYNNVLNLAGKLNLNTELDVISNLDVMLAMDSGNTHIAAMLGIKVITIWNVTHPYAGFSGFNQPEDYQLTANRKQFPLIPTSIYGNRYPEDYNEAARSISPEHIIDKIETILLD